MRDPLVALLLLIVLWAISVKGASNYAQAHAYCDAVVEKRFSAAYNEWRFRHPTDKVEGTWDHTLGADAGDMKRWQEVRKAFRELESKMREAGYE